MTSDDLCGSVLEDDALLAALRRIVATVDAPPGGVRAGARAAILTRRLDDAIARLIGDSRVRAGDEAYEAVRGSADHSEAPWLLSFAAGGIQIDMEVDGVHQPVRLIGQVSGAAAADRCYLETPHGRRPIDVDELGRFVIEGLEPGPVRLRCGPAAGRSVVTSWIRI